MNSLNKSLKVLLIPNKPLPYDLNQLDGIHNALKEFDIYSHIYLSSYSEDRIIKFLEENSFDIIFAVNKGRPQNLKKTIRFISWFQDFYYDSDNLLENYEKSDIVYFYTSQDSFGVSKKINCFSSTLYPGIELSKIPSKLKNLNDNYSLVDGYQSLEFSICGYMPATILAPFFDLYFRNYDYEDKNFTDNYFIQWFSSLTHQNEYKYDLSFYKNFIVDLQIIVESNYIPLSGNLDVKFLALKLTERILKDFKYLNSEIFRQWRNFFSTDYPRFLDRMELARLLSKHSFNYALFGKEWNLIGEFDSFSGNHIENQNDLFEIYQKTKINLYNNTHGLGMHSKVFEILANGGFLAVPESKKNFLVGGINEGFNEFEHFVTFSSNNFEDLVNDWLFNTEKRVEIGKNARKAVINNHTWKKRVKKILSDLKI